MKKKGLLRMKLLRISFLLMFIIAFNFSYAQTVNFTYTGSPQSWVVPACVTSITVTMAGADGGGSAGGNGAVITGTIAVTPGQTLNIYVGGSGACPGAGWNGGGTGQNANTTANRSCGGGGASDIRIGGTALSNRVMVAAGGGGTGGGTQDAIGGAGGCASGANGNSPFGQGGYGASQSAGGNGGPPWISSGNPGFAGSLGQGGNGGTDPCYNNSPGGGGGGGYYGGGGGGSDCYSSSPYGGGSGGGGSSLVPAGGGCTAGSNNGNGYVNITYTQNGGVATASNTGPYCEGDNILLSSTGTGTFSWTGPNGYSSNQQNPTITGSTAAMSGTYTVTVSQSGCDATATTDVIVNPMPNILSVSDLENCAGENTGAINFSSSNAGTVFSWQNDNTGIGLGSNGTGSIPGFVTTNGGGTTITGNIIVTPALGSCVGAPESFSIIVNPLPTVNAGSDQTVCEGVAVTLNGAGANTYSWNNGITDGVPFVQPPGATTYTLMGTDGNGCTNSDQVLVTVNALPNVSAGQDQSVCEGVAVTLNGSGASNYSWDNGVTDGNSFIQAPGIMTYTVTGTDINGCVNIDQVDVTVSAFPVVNAGIDQEVCEGTAVTLSGSGATSYTWTNGVTDGVSFNPPIGTTTYTVTGTSGAGCTNTDQVDVTVNALPNVYAGTDQTVCEGESVTLNGSGAINYSWDSGITDGVPFVQTPGSTTYTLTGTDGNTCSNTDQVIVTVNALPTVNAGNDQEVCEGVSIVLSATGASTYAWDNGIVNGVSFVQAPGTMTYTVTGTDGNGCVNVDQVQVVVNVNPTPVITGDLSYCNGSSALISTTQVYNSYVWSTGENASSINVTIANNPITVEVWDINGCYALSAPYNVSEASVIYTDETIEICQGDSTLIHGVYESASGNYVLNAVTSQGCDSVSTVTLIVNDLPGVYAGPDKFLCEGEELILLGTGAPILSWNNGVNDGVAFTPPVGSTLYVLTGIDNNGCENIDTVSVLVYALPQVIAGSDQTICDGDGLILAGSGADFYSWSNNVIDGQEFYPSTTTTYTVTGTTNFGCQNTDQVTVNVNPIPNVDAGPDQFLCYGEQTSLSGSGASTYQWDQNVVNGESFTPPVGTTIYTVIGDQVGCTNTDQVSITVNDQIIVDFSSDINGGCIPLTVNLQNLSPSGESCSWTLSNGFGSSNWSGTALTFQQGGCVDVTLTVNENGCSNSLTIPDFICADYNPIADFDASPYQVSELDPYVEFYNTSINADDYEWNMGVDSDILTDVNPNYTFPTEPGTYEVTLIAYTEQGCSDTTVQHIVVIEELIYYIPNSFTPDGDIFNQTFQPVFTSGHDPYDFTMQIFNRWGEVIFETHDPDIGWDGTYADEGQFGLCQDGSYVWKIDFKVKRHDENIVIQGHVNLIR